MNLATDENLYLRLFIDFTNNLKIYESQLKFLQELNNFKKERNTENIVSAFSSLQNYMIPIKKIEDLTLPTMVLLVEYLDEMILEKLEQAIQNFSLNHNRNKNFHEIYEELYIQVLFFELPYKNFNFYFQKSKLQASLDCVPLAATYDKKDIFAKPIEDEIWCNLFENSQIKVFLFFLWLLF